MRSLLVTGTQRSGTTLLDRLLDAHSEISVLSQPFPYLFIEVKREFLRQRGLGEAAYPLSPLFDENRYRPEDLTGFLDTFRLDATRLRSIFEDMAHYSGQLTRFSPSVVESALAELDTGDVFEIVSRLERSLSRKPDASVFGSKETNCEEFVPFHVQRGGHAAIVVRDPRDMVASLNHGTGRDHTGRLKPLLFNLRNWRKSVAFALHMSGHPRFAQIRYESLTHDPPGALAELTDMLGVEPYDVDAFAGELVDATGHRWSGNSSFGTKRGVSGDSIGRWRDTLAPSTARFVEAACLPEMIALDIPVSVMWEETTSVLSDFDDPYPLERPELSAYVSRSAVAAEIRRLALLDAPASTETRAKYLFEDVRQLLRAAVVTAAGGTAE